MSHFATQHTIAAFLNSLQQVQEVTCYLLCLRWLKLDIIPPVVDIYELPKLMFVE
jgi:hypothetical protein